MTHSTCCKAEVIQDKFGGIICTKCKDFCNITTPPPVSSEIEEEIKKILIDLTDGALSLEGCRGDEETFNMINDYEDGKYLQRLTALYTHHTSVQVKEEEINKIIKDKKLDTNKISDGYHTFEELYDHRITLWIALSSWVNSCDNLEQYPCWKSKKHSDGTEWDGWFISGIGIKKGKQMTYHLPIDRWDELDVPELEQAPEWDGHTPADVLERIKKYLY